jgi:colicin import membrane protein
MTSQKAYLEFAPPPTPGLLRGLVLAVLAHGVLLAILTVGVQWKREAPVVTAEAELWSALPQEAAPPPPPPEPPAPEPEPLRAQPSAPQAQAAPPQSDPSIAIERDKAKQRKERQQRELMEKEKKLKEQQLADKAAAEKLAKEKVQKAKELKEAKDAKEALAAKNAKAKAADPAVDAKKLADVRAEALKRMAALAAGTGSENSRGTASQSSGPSAGYAGRIRARIKPNITFTDTVSGNPTAEVEVRTSPDGTIISRRLTVSSGVKSWDDAVLSAIDKTEVLPRDTDGRVPPALVISFRPRD